MGESARYLYAVCRDLDPAALAGVPALGDRALELVAHEELVAVVSTVDLAEFGEDELKANLERLEWLEETARRHDGVIQAASAAAPTAPLRLATICLDDDGVRRRLAEWYLDLRQVLDRIEGRREWSVKVFASDEPEPAEPVAVRASSGAEYLQRKRQAAAARVRQESSALDVAERVHELVSAGSVASRRLPAQDPRLTGHEGIMVLNGAYLVAAGEEEAFALQVQAAAQEHPEVTVDCRGPWPPYSFAMLAQ